MTAWLRAHALMTARSAQRLRSTAQRLRSLPVCARAYADGTLSGGQIEAIVARLDDETVEIFAAQEAELVPYLVPLTVAGVSRAMAAWVTRARPEPSEPKEPERALHLSRTLDDRWVLDGSLDPEGGAIVAAALRLATPEQADLPGEPAARRADALPGCDRPSVCCEGHHVVWVTQNGPTELANLVLVCSRTTTSSTSPAGTPNSAQRHAPRHRSQWPGPVHVTAARRDPMVMVVHADAHGLGQEIAVSRNDVGPNLQPAAKADGVNPQLTADREQTRSPVPSRPVVSRPPARKVGRQRL